MNMHCRNNRVSAQPFLRPVIAENDIIDLQNILLTNGIHFISTPDSSAFRTIITRFLSSLNSYQSIGFLSMDAAYDLPDEIEPLFSLLTLNHYLDNDELLQYYLLEEFRCDFLWIESSDEFDGFIEQIMILGIHLNIPIVVVG